MRLPGDGMSAIGLIAVVGCGDVSSEGESPGGTESGTSSGSTLSSGPGSAGSEATDTTSASTETGSTVGTTTDEPTGTDTNGDPPQPPSACDGSPPSPDAFYVAMDGSDEAGDGSSTNPWASISFAVDNVSDGDEIVVRPGEYSGRVRLEGVFSAGIFIRAETPYQSRLRNNGTVVTCFSGCEGITLSGFDIAHDGPGAAGLVVQIADVGARNIRLVNNILHDSYNNDILKINNGADNVVVERNLFYNQQGSDEHIDANSVVDVIIQDNVFVSDFAASGRANANDTSSFVVIKDSNGNDDGILGAQRVTVRRNVFANWEGSPGQHFVRIGEDGTANFEASDVTVENNLMLGTTSNPIRAAFGVYGSQNVLFRHNTVVGDLPSNAFAIRMIAVGQNMANRNIEYFNNIWSDPTTTMDDFSDTTPGQTDPFTIANNLYFNGGAPVPEDGAELVNPSDDAAAIVGDPSLPDPSGAAIPTWDAAASELTDGSTTVCQAHRRLVEQHGTPAAGSIAVDAADPTASAVDDILGNPRGASPDIGAVERL